MRAVNRWLALSCAGLCFAAMGCSSSALPPVPVTSLPSVAAPEPEPSETAAPMPEERLGTRAAGAVPVPPRDTQWSTRIGSLTVGAAGAQATFSDLRSTCGAFGLTIALTMVAGDVRECLGETDRRHAALELAAGLAVSWSATPDDAKGRCVTAALGSGKLKGLTCSLEADVSR